MEEAQKDTPDLHFDVMEEKEKGKFSERTDVMEIIDVETKRDVAISQNSDFREHSKNSLESVAGEASQQASEQRSMEKVMDPEVHKRTSEYREHSQNPWSSEKETDEKTSRKTVHQTLDKDAHLGNSESQEHSQNSRKKQAGVDTGDVEVTVSTGDNQCSTVSSDFLEHSQNLLSSGEPKIDKGEANVSSSDRDGQCLAMAREFRELSSNLRVETECSENTQQKQNTKIVCISEPSKYSRDSLGGVPSFSWFKSMSQIVGLTATWQQDKVEGNPMGANTASNAKTNSNPVHTEFNFFL